MKISTVLCLILIPASAFLYLSTCAKTVEISFKPKIGDRINSQTILDQTIFQTVQNKTFKSVQTIINKYTFTVKDIIEDTTVRIAVKIEEISLTSETPAGKLSFSSKNGAWNNPEYAVLNKITGKEFELFVTTTGEIKKISGFDEILKSILKDPTTVSPALINTVKSLLNQDAFKSAFSYLFDYYPGKTVKPGESWTREQKASAFIPVTTRNLWALASVTGNQAVLKLSSGIKTENSLAAFEGKQEGEITVSLPSGWIKKGKIIQNLTGSTALPGAFKDNAKTSLKIQSTINIKTSKINR
ncbi:MAG: DUF6263 family protein [Spirochaetota bacterium]